ncbi:VOC family protein [Brevibacterium litoralis]|uniref:VOC family protein n=1 Tax=Brevibacterium litoralis TaxID=3138935 RepID=UPI0032EC7BED
MSIPAALDHLVLAVPDLAAGVHDFTARTGIVPTYGGAHEGRGTANYLVGLDPTGTAAEAPSTPDGTAAGTDAGAEDRPLMYLEIIGPDLEQDVPEGAPLAFGLEAITEPTLVTWAVHPAGFDDRVADARTAGVDFGVVNDMSRRTPAGDLLEWRLTQRLPLPQEGVQPFLIDWQDSVHPALGEIGRMGLDVFEVRTPVIESTTKALEVLGAADTTVVDADAFALRATLSGPAGSIGFGGE